MFHFSQPFQGVVRHLVIINVLAFLAANILLGDMTRTSLGMMEFAAWPPSSGLFQPYQILTYMFLHDPSNILHLGFNMLMLWMFGSMVEAAWGPKRFLFFYLFCGVGSLVYHFFIQSYLQEQAGPLLGASGAIYGVLIAFAYLYPDLELRLLFLPIPIKAKYLALGLLALDIFRGFSGSQSQTAHFAHAGGAFFGFLLLLFWYKGRTRV